MLPFSSPPSTQHFGVDGGTNEKKERNNPYGTKTILVQCSDSTLKHLGMAAVR